MSSPDEPGFCQYDGCGKPIEDQPARGRRRLFCSPTCRSAARRQRVVSRTRAEPVRQLFARAVAEVLSQDPRPLRTLAAELPPSCFISAATLSQWQTGRALPRPTDEIQHRLYALERLLAVPPETLVRALFVSHGRPLPRRSTAIPQSAAHPVSPSALTLEEAGRQLDEAMAALGGNHNAALLTVEIDQRFFIDEKRRPMRCEVTYTVKAMEPGIQHYWVTYAHDAAVPVSVVASSACHLGKVIEPVGPIKRGRKAEVLEATELVFTRPLEVNKPYRFAFDQEYGPTASTALPEPMLRHTVREAATQTLRMEIQFDPLTRPRELRRAWWDRTPAGRLPRQTSVVPLGPDGRAEPIVEHHPDLIGHGFTWTWPSADEALP